MTLFDDAEPASRDGDLFTVDGLLRLLQLPGVGPQRAIKLANRFATWRALVHADETDLRVIVGAGASKVQRSLNYVVDPTPLPEGVRAIGRFDADWPIWLGEIANPPAVIYIRGTLPTNEALAVVGTRSPTAFGLRVVERVVESAAGRGMGIVSGLALGIDSAAHESALRLGTPTWAILGGGVDVPTPRQNIDLADQVLNAGGGLLSEQPPGTEPNPQRLVSRNRLQSAASVGVVVAQCGIPSGTLYTARFALEQGRRLIVPRPRAQWEKEPESAGNIALTNPSGCDPRILNATGKQAAAISRRRPVADVVLHDAGDIEGIWG